MIRSIETALPGFVGLREFFRRLPTSFETVPVETADIERFRKGILEIHGTPRDYAETAVWAWFATAKAHEVRRYSDGTWYVRFGVREICRARLSEAERQLSLAFDAAVNMKFYTLIDGSGVPDEDSDVEFQYSDIEGEELPDAGRDGWGRLHRYIQTMQSDIAEDDFFIVSDRHRSGSYLQAIAARQGDQLRYHVEYCLECYVWHFAMNELVSRKELERLVEVFRTGGYPALQDAAEWRCVDSDEIFRAHGKAVCIDEWLMAAGMRAEAEGDKVLAERCRRCFGTGRGRRRPLSVHINFNSPETQIDEVLEHANSKSAYTQRERQRIHLYAELARIKQQQ